MKKKIILSMVVAAFAIGTVGCGSDSKTVKKEDDTPKVSNPTPVHHIGTVERTEQQEFVLPNFDAKKKLDNGEKLVIAEDAKAYYMTIEHNNLAKNVQFYIDTDSDSKTGDITEGGAELLVENGQLYRFLDANATWKKSTDVNVSAYNAGASKDTIKLKKTLLDSPYFGVKAQVLGDKWIPKFSSPKLDTFPKTYYKVDDLSDYNDMYTKTPYISSKDKKANMFLDKNSGKIDILLSSEKFEDRVQVYIDSDNNPSTGFAPQLEGENGTKINMWKNMGADYQITENSQFFKWDSKKKDWIYVQDIPYVLPTDDVKKSIIMHLKKSALKNIDNDKVRLSVITYDTTDKKDWKIKYAMPELNATKKIPSYEH